MSLGKSRNTSLIGRPSHDYMPDDNLHLGKGRRGTREEREERSEAELLWESPSSILSRSLPSLPQMTAHKQGKVFLFANLRTTTVSERTEAFSHNVIQRFPPDFP